MPARLVVILTQQSSAPPVFICLLRADVPSGRQSLYANASYKSPFQPISPDTDPDASALTTGAVTEQTLLLTRNPGDTLAQVESELQSRQAAYQAQVTALTTWVRYGTFFNGTTWTMQGV